MIISLKEELHQLEVEHIYWISREMENADALPHVAFLHPVNFIELFSSHFSVAIYEHIE